MVTLYCPDGLNLKLGPGLPGSDRVIEFLDGYADVSEADPLFDEKMSWVNRAGCPHIRLLETDEVPAGSPGSDVCPVCGDTFASPRKLNGHILGAHRGKRE